jgi:hypothetical protein
MQTRPHAVGSPGNMRWLVLGMVATLSFCAYAQEVTSDEPSITNSTSQSAVKRDMFISLKAVKQYFPAVTRYRADTNPGALGSPIGTRAVNFTSDDSASKVTLSVDEYENPGDAQSAYEQAAQKAQRSEVSPIALSNVGQEVFANTITESGETHIEIVALDGALIVGTKLSGYDSTTENIAKLASVAREEVAQARSHVGKFHHRR